MRSTLREMLLGVTLASLVTLPGPVQAAESIRVLLYAGLQRVEVSSASELNVRVAGGGIRAQGTNLVFVPESRSMRVNGEYLNIDRVTVEGEGDQAVLALKKPAEAPGRPEAESEFAAVFLRLQQTQTRQVSKSRRSARHQPRSSNSLVVTGTLDVVSDGTSLAVINTLDLEEYVQGVVPSEMSAGWHLEALKVQAVAARTYALYQKEQNVGRDHDLVATVLDQVYRGQSGVNDRVRQAVKATEGLTVTYEGRPIFAAFSSTAAGPTEDAMNVWSKELPYLRGVECPFDRDSPYYEWRTAFPLDLLESKLRQAGMDIGTVATVTPYTYSRSGRVAQIRILHSSGELILSGQDLRRLVGYRVIPSTQFRLDRLGHEVALSGFGNGHAVGLCQWGTKELAELGYPFSAILTYYYPGTQLVHTSQLGTVSP